MLNIIKEKLDLSPDLKKKIDWAKNYTSTSITLEKGHLIRLEPSNLAYVDPHKVKINNYEYSDTWKPKQGVEMEYYRRASI